ncbi:MAG TPA: endo-1,4-beta-xylanase, partial [Flavisolibacter sp.]|nr:endo-1,4-beta-xylanase [Flavisolibacter sp.]
MRKNLLLLLASLFSFAGMAQPSFVGFQAESGTLGSEWLTAVNGTATVVRISTDGGGQNPATANRIITYSVTFPQPGTYFLYARVYVGPGNFNDDSYYYGNGFGSKTVTNDNDWILANGLASAGYSNSIDYVTDNPGTTGSNVFKWVNMSIFNGGEAPVSFTVAAGSLTQTFQIGARENGLDIEKFVFGLNNYRYTVSNLDNAQEGTSEPPPPPFNPPGPPIAQGKPKYLGGVYSNPQKVNFDKYWNQVTPENAGKWGSVEGTRDVMNWTELDEAYNFAKSKGYPFKMHTLIWGAQQPTWIESLSVQEQREEIEEWYAALAQRYPAIDIIEVVNEPLHQKPDAPGRGNYINALGGNGASGWEWVLQSFRLARQHFPNAQLLINDYSIINSTTSTNTYMTIINLLKAENLIDGVGEQGHAFTTFNTSLTAMLNNLNTLATSGLPLYITELDIDGAPVQTTVGDNAQLT